MTDIGGFAAAADDLEALADALEEAADDIDQAIDEGVQQTALLVERSAKENAPVDTGRLRRSIEARQLSPGRWAIGSTVNYADDVEYGTAPHPITPDDAEALHFFVDGEEVFSQRVQHPGTPAQPFLRPALREHQSDLTENIADAIEALLTEHFDS